MNDPIKHCRVHKEIGCAHVDGYLCDFPECSIMKEYTMRDVEVGQIDLPADARTEVANLVSLLGETYDFVNGKTAAYWALCCILSQHLGEGKQ